MNLDERSQVVAEADLSAFRTLVDVCRHHARTTPSSAAYAWLNSREIETQCLTYAELDRRARALGARVAETGLAGKPVLLLYGPGLEFIIAFLGGMYGGAVMVPAYPPRPNEGVERIARIAADCGAAAILTEDLLAERVCALIASTPALSSLPVVVTDKLVPDAERGWVPPPINENSIAFLQYTSGSTGTPKGVQVSHRNILANQAMIYKGFGHSEQTVFVGWLPLHHDMGLVGNVLQPLYLGIPSVLMAPETFIQKPVRWLRAISRYRATTSGGPNFGYELCARKVSDEDIAALDLSSWQVAYNGAEPIRADTLKRFSQRFARAGFRSRAFYPCYGMAEATLFITGGLPAAEPVVAEVSAAALEAHRVEVGQGGAPGSARAVVGCGRPWLDESVLIVDTDTLTPCGPERVGEIWVRGPNVSIGYLNRPEANRETFAGHLASGDGPFLRTGDLGFMRDGELFVTGRAKDLIILQGRNHYPQDIESTVGSAHPAFRVGGTAAFTIEADGIEQLAILQELKQFDVVEAAGESAKADLLRVIRRALSDVHGINVHGCVFLQEGQIPKTSSGKIRRRSCVALYRSSGKLRPMNAWVEAEAQR